MGFSSEKKTVVVTEGILKISLHDMVVFIDKTMATKQFLKDEKFIFQNSSIHYGCEVFCRFVKTLFCIQITTITTVDFWTNSIVPISDFNTKILEKFHAQKGLILESPVGSFPSTKNVL